MALKRRGGGGFIALAVLCKSALQAGRFHCGHAAILRSLMMRQDSPAVATSAAICGERRYGSSSIGCVCCLIMPYMFVFSRASATHIYIGSAQDNQEKPGAIAETSSECFRFCYRSSMAFG